MPAACSSRVVHCSIARHAQWFALASDSLVSHRMFLCLCLCLCLCLSLCVSHSLSVSVSVPRSRVRCRAVAMTTVGSALCYCGSRAFAGPLLFTYLPDRLSVLRPLVLAATSRGGTPVMHLIPSAHTHTHTHTRARAHTRGREAGPGGGGDKRLVISVSTHARVLMRAHMGAESRG